MAAVEVRPVTADRFGDLADLFDSNGTTRGCWCMYFIASRADFDAGWRDGGNRRAIEQLTTRSETPVGLLAYDGRGQPVGWCAVGPRSRYERAIGRRARVLAGRDPTEDDDVWLVPCFFVRVGHRHQGITRALLDASVRLAEEHGATAVEGFPRAAGLRPSPDDYLGREELFTSCGFTATARPNAKRVVVRRRLAPSG